MPGVRTNSDWLNELRAHGPLRDAALEGLRTLMLKGLSRALQGWASTSGREFDSLAEDFVQEALLKVLENLDTYQGRSAFTTWCLKIAVRVSLTELRRRRWKDVSLESILDSEGSRWVMKSSEPGPAAQAEQSEFEAFTHKAMAEELTEHQRRALAAVFGGLPLEEAARRLGTNRNALYKSIHDARVKLKRRFVHDGMILPGMTMGPGGGKIPGRGGVS